MGRIVEFRGIPIHSPRPLEEDDLQVLRRARSQGAPEEYLEFIEIANGGSIDHVFREPEDEECYASIDWVFCARSILDDYWCVRYLNEAAFPLFSCGGIGYHVFVGESGAVYYLRHDYFPEEAELGAVKLANSLLEFCDSLVLFE